MPSTVVGGTVFRLFALNCSPCSLSLTHQPSATSHSPAVTEGSDPMTVVSSRCPRVRHAKDAKSAFIVVKGDALDQTGDFLGHGFMFRYCGVHLGGELFSHGWSALNEGRRVLSVRKSSPSARLSRISDKGEFANQFLSK